MKATVKRTTRTGARLTAAALALACPAAVWAQCAMCQTSAANVDPAGVKYLNYAVFLLMMPPATIFCGFFYAAYKRRNAPGETEEAQKRTHVESPEDL
jgi:hypothetical protein